MQNLCTKPIGAGPYRLVSFQPGQQMIVEANPYYAGNKNDFDKLILFSLMKIVPSLPRKVGSGCRAYPSSMAVGSVNNMKLWVRPSVENRGIVFPTTPAGKKTHMVTPLAMM